ncbi:MAG TPA: hypothetical protein VE129_15615 [Thermoanaerobaculia bacterium]|nr:hypothetical protein [Thermoanaerobaculia bacterium]
MAVLAAALAAYLSQKLFSGMPRIGDEVSYAFQGRILASGRLFLAPPAVPEAFAVQHVIQTADRWCGKYPPGLPLLLATGWLVDAPWLVNPVLFGVAVYGLFRLGSKLWGPPTGLLGAFLFATLPFGFLQAASFMSHIASLACVTWCLVLLAEGSPVRSRTLLLASGFLGGFAFLVRPVSAVALLVGPVLLLLWQVPRWRDRLRAAGLLIVGSVLPLAFLLWVQWRSFGNPFLTGYAVYDPLDSFLGDRNGMWTLAEILRSNVRWYATALPVVLWAVPGPPFLWLLLLLVRPRKEDLVAGLAAAGPLLVHLCFFGFDIFYGGPRYALESTGFLALLASRVLGNAAVLLSRASAGIGPRFAFPPAATSAVLAVAVAVATVAREAPKIRAHAWNYLGTPNDPMAGADRAGVGPDSLVLVDFADPRRSTEYTASDSPAYFGYFFRNALEPSSGPRVYARALAGRERELMAAYPRAETWRVVVSLSLPEVGEAPMNGPSILRGIRWSRVK